MIRVNQDKTVKNLKKNELNPRFFNIEQGINPQKYII